MGRQRLPRNGLQDRWPTIGRNLVFRPLTRIWRDYRAAYGDGLVVPVPWPAYIPNGQGHGLAQSAGYTVDGDDADRRRDVAIYSRNQDVGLFSPIHLLSLVTLVSIIFGWAAARGKRIRAHRYTMISLWIGSLGINLVFTLLPGRILYRVIFGG